ncbi:putative sensor domain DACNV-containing protein [Dyadobacter sp. 676]|uniref:Sensor domain DACNV-containing protein n=1 Tax=Dyadobacter sp. 676 TaxID=3088362 RepID=A0AAU8FNT4_9BACT
MITNPDIFPIETGDTVPVTTYKAARSVAPLVAGHFRRHHEAVSKYYEQELAPRPDARIIETIIDTTFWASLRREEGRSPKVSIAYLPPEAAEHPLIFAEKLALTANTLTKLAPAVERSGIHLGVWLEDGELRIWGTTRVIPGLCFVLEVIEPGMLVVKHRRVEGFGKFVNVAVLKGDQVKIVNEESRKVKDCPSLINSLMGFSSTTLWSDYPNLLVQLAASMRSHERGGILLVVPKGKDRWRESIIHPITYDVQPPFSELADLHRKYVEDPNPITWQNQFSSAVANMAGLTAVDGATIINDRYELLAFGAKIGRAPSGKPVEEILITEPVIGNAAMVVHPVQNGGTRHLSAAQFVHDQRDSIALVASQDGRFTIFSWSKCENIVQAHRVDALLL